ncbi:hypothetical protein [Bifidobacterium sp.]|uniref:hypothetical protein n=1 Tax=Bifidobacterium sp. TaxID=41200 RepID=UPI0039EC6EC4
MLTSRTSVNVDIVIEDIGYPFCVFAPLQRGFIYLWENWVMRLIDSFKLHRRAYHERAIAGIDKTHWYKSFIGKESVNVRVRPLYFKDTQSFARFLELVGGYVEVVVGNLHSAKDQPGPSVATLAAEQSHRDRGNIFVKVYNEDSSKVASITFVTAIAGEAPSTTARGDPGYMSKIIEAADSEADTLPRFFGRKHIAGLEPIDNAGEQADRRDRNARFKDYTISGVLGIIGGFIASPIFMYLLGLKS